MRYRLTPEAFAKISKYEEMVQSDAQKMIQKLKEQLAQLTIELNKYEAENDDLAHVWHPFSPKRFVLPLPAAVKLEPAVKQEPV